MDRLEEKVSMLNMSRKTNFLIIKVPSQASGEEDVNNLLSGEINGRRVRAVNKQA